MEICEIATMPDGTKIQIEDWRKDYFCFKTLSIAVYPIMQRLPQSIPTCWHEIGRRFRVDICRGWENNEEVKKAFSELQNGTKEIKDFANQFWNSWAVECI